MSYRCGTCKSSNVSINVKREKIEHPARDERGREIFEEKLNPETGRYESRQKMVAVPVRGLGTWRCHSSVCRGVKRGVERVQRAIL